VDGILELALRLSLDLDTQYPADHLIKATVIIRKSPGDEIQRDLTFLVLSRVGKTILALG
jgi:hypothetical protein